MIPSTPLLAAAPLVAGLIAPALVGAVPAQSRPVAIVHQATTPMADVIERDAASSTDEQRRVLNYWTPERMAAARPIGLLDLVAQRLAAENLLTEHLPAGGGGLLGRLSAQSPPPGGRAPLRQSARPRAVTTGSRWVTGGAVSKTTGRVFLTLAGVDFVCSAGTVRSRNKDVVVTAGHCVKDGAGEWAENWTFVPGYRAGGDRPYGSYTARRMFVAGPWSRKSDDSYDVGMVALNTSGGKHVAEAVGAQEIAFNAARGGRLFGFGYPADPPYDGEQLFYCSGAVRDDPNGTTRDQGLRCGMTAGSSGGPWLAGFNPASGKGRVVSVSSFKYSDDRDTMYGPYFGDAAQALFRTAERA